jgi:hypothetical protein
MLAGADRTAFAGEDDRTMLAPPPRPVPETRPATPVMTPPRRRQVAEERSGIHPVVYLLLLAVVAVGGWLVYQQMTRRSTVGPVAGDTTVVDTARQDTIDNTNALALSMEGLRFLNAGDPAMALDFFRRAVSIDERNAEYRDQMAVALMRLGRHGEAADLLESTIRIDNRYDLLYSHLAEARLAMGDTVSAVRALEEFVEVTQAAADRQRAVRMLEVLRARIAAPPVLPVPGPTDTGGFEQAPVIRNDTLVIPSRPAPRDTLRIGAPG